MLILTIVYYYNYWRAINDARRDTARVVSKISLSKGFFLDRVFSTFFNIRRYSRSLGTTKTVEHRCWYERPFIRLLQDSKHDYSVACSPNSVTHDGYTLIIRVTRAMCFCS